MTARLEIPIGTAFYLYRCREDDGGGCGVRRAILATLGLAGLRVGELYQLDDRHVDLAGERIHVRESKTGAGIRIVDVVPRLRHELEAYRGGRPPVDLDAPAFPTRPGGRRDRQHVGGVVQSTLKRANELRAQRGEPPILAHVTPHTLRRTYISFMLAAGYDVPYVQAQVGHEDPTTTLGIYARVISQPNRERPRKRMENLLRGDVVVAASERDEQAKLF